jgi:hypothetical protein
MQHTPSWNIGQSPNTLGAVKPNTRFLNQPKHFWANVRTIGQEVGYTVRGEGVIRVPTMDDIR